MAAERTRFPRFHTILAMALLGYIGIIHGRDSTCEGLALSTIKQPTTAHELLVNMRTALEQGLLIPQSFYTDDNLLRFFGGSRIQWIANTNTGKQVVLRGLTRVPNRDDSTTRIGIIWSSSGPHGQPAPEAHIFAAASLICSCELRVADIDAVFNPSGRQVATRPVPSHFPALAPSAHEFGNKRLTYPVQTQPQWTSQLRVDVDEDGKLLSVEAIQRTHP